MSQINSYYAKTHQGPYLNVNEDDVLVDLEYKLFSIYDGFGGGSVGDVSVDIVRKSIEVFFQKVSSDPDATMPYFFNPQYLIETNCLVNALEIAHSNILKHNQKKAMNDRGAVSTLLALLSENILSITSVGNCSAFLYRGGRVSVIASPDCITPIGSIENNMTNRTFPLSAIGLFDKIMPKIWEVNIKDGDKVILLTDGVYNKISLDDIKSVIENSINEDFNIVKRLFEVSNDRGNLDNQSAIVISL